MTRGRLKDMTAQRCNERKRREIMVAKECDARGRLSRVGDGSSPVAKRSAQSDRRRVGSARYHLR
jgi:hypothetical protein